MTSNSVSGPEAEPTLRMGGIRKVYQLGDNEVVALDHAELTVAAELRQHKRRPGSIVKLHQILKPYGFSRANFKKNINDAATALPAV